MPSASILLLVVGIVLVIAFVACAVMAPKLPKGIRLAVAVLSSPLALVCVYGFAAAGEASDPTVGRIGCAVVFVACLVAFGRLVFQKSVHTSSRDSAND